VLESGFVLWLGDNIAILSMVKRAHPLLSNNGLSKIQVRRASQEIHRITQV
jgi:hypothetical protein